MSGYAILEQTVDRAVESDFIPANDRDAVLERIITMGNTYGFSPDEFAVFALVETEGLNPRADNGIGCYGIIQFCHHSGAHTVGYGSNPSGITNLSVLEQLELTDQYLNAQGGPYGSLEDLYLSVLYPAARDIQDPNQCLGIPGQQAAVLYDDAQGCITRNSLREGLLSNAEARLGSDISNMAGAPPGSAGLSSFSTGGSGLGSNNTASRINCPPWHYQMNEAKITTGCDMSGSIGFGSGMSVTPGAGQGVPGAAGSGPLINVPVDVSMLQGQLLWPTRNSDGSPYGEITQVFDPAGTIIGRVHMGIDIPAPMHTPLVASADGVVVVSGLGSEVKINGMGFTGYGYVVLVEHQRPGKTTIWTLYSHLPGPGVPVGTVVRAGQGVGSVGSTGHSTGPHLHYEVRLRAEGSQIDPAPLLKRM